MDIRVCATRQEMGQASGAVGAAEIARIIDKNGRAVVMFASAVSQNEFLDALASADRVDWSRVTAFHLDEYIGLGPDHPASFRRFLRDRLWSRVKPAAFHELHGDSSDVDQEIRSYSELLRSQPPDLGFLGIGENGHLAFNDPPAQFEDSEIVRAVQLDDVCRMQQVHDGAFPTFQEVPRTALTVTIPAIFRIPRLILNVPGPAKADAVKRTVQGSITPDCPASVLQRHTNTTLFLDSESARFLRK